MLQLSIGEVGRCPERPTDEDVPFWDDRTGRIYAFGTREDGAAWMHAPGLASYALEAAAESVVAHPYEGAARERVTDFFRRTVLPVALQLRGLEVLHASAVVLDGGVVAFAGPSGAGKSTMARALNGTGLLQWADDALACELNPDGVDARYLPFASRVHPETARTLAITPGPIGDFVLGQRLPLRSVYLLEPTSDDEAGVRTDVLTKGDAVSALLPQAFYFDLNDARVRDRMTRHYLELASRLEVRRLRYPEGLDHLGATTATVRQLIESHV